MRPTISPPKSPKPASRRSVPVFHSGRTPPGSWFAPTMRARARVPPMLIQPVWPTCISPSRPMSVSSMLAPARLRIRSLWAPPKRAPGSSSGAWVSNWFRPMLAVRRLRLPSSEALARTPGRDSASGMAVPEFARLAARQCCASWPTLRATALLSHSRPSVGLASSCRLAPTRRPLSMGSTTPAPAAGAALRPSRRSSVVSVPVPRSISRKPSSWPLRMIGRAVVLPSSSSCAAACGRYSGGGVCANAEAAARASMIPAMGRSSGDMGGVLVGSA